MQRLDDETVERVARWCAEAGRQAGAAEIRAALGALSWDELLAARALLADPPPVRPLGPFALADLARGAPADVAAEREREGRYRRESDEATSPAAVPLPSPAARRGARRGKAPARATVVVRRASDRAPAPQPAPAPRPHLADLFRPEGRATLERLFRRLGGRRAALLAELSASYLAPEGLGDRELEALLAQHGLTSAFTHRERDELLHALRAEGGSLQRAAGAVGLERPALEAALARLGATAEAERIRDERRADLRRRSTLADRVTALLGDEPRLRDLGLLAEVEADLASRLPEHVRALRAAGEHPLDGLARTLSLGPAQAAVLAARFHLEAPGGAAAPRPRVAHARGPRPAGARPGGPPRGAPGRPAGRGSPRAGKGGARPPGGQGGASRGARPGARSDRPGRPGKPPGARPLAGGRPSGPRPPGGRPPGARPSGPRTRAAGPGRGPRRGR